MSLSTRASVAPLNAEPPVEPSDDFDHSRAKIIGAVAETSASSSVPTFADKLTP